MKPIDATHSLKYLNSTLYFKNVREKSCEFFYEGEWLEIEAGARFKSEFKLEKM